MRTQVKKAVCAGQETMEYALLGRRRTESSGPQEPGRERLKELLLPMVREAVQKQLKEQQDYYRSRPSLALRQAEQISGRGMWRGRLRLRYPGRSMNSWRSVSAAKG